VLELNRTIHPVDTQTAGGLHGPVANTTVEGFDQASLDALGVLLAPGQGIPPVVWVVTAKTGWFNSRPDQKADPPTLYEANPDLNPSTHSFHVISFDLPSAICGSAFQHSHFWSDSHMPLLVTKY